MTRGPRPGAPWRWCIRAVVVEFLSIRREGLTYTEPTCLHSQCVEEDLRVRSGSVSQWRHAISECVDDMPVSTCQENVKLVTWSYSILHVLPTITKHYTNYMSLLLLHGIHEITTHYTYYMTLLSLHKIPWYYMHYIQLHYITCITGYFCHYMILQVLHHITCITSNYNIKL